MQCTIYCLVSTIGWDRLDWFDDVHGRLYIVLLDILLSQSGQMTVQCD